jgi:hypothetical protein
MRPLRLPSALGSILTRAGLTVGGGGAGSLATLALIHRPDTTAIAAGAAIAALAANVAESAGNALPGVISAISNLLTGCIRARADAKSTNINAATRAKIAEAGLDPSKTASAAEMLRAMSGNPDLPKDRRPTDETLVKLQGASPHPKQYRRAQHRSRLLLATADRRSSEVRQPVARGVGWSRPADGRAPVTAPGPPSRYASYLFGPGVPGRQ